MLGDATLFTRADEIEAAVADLRPRPAAWEGADGAGDESAGADRPGAGELPQYEAGSQGPNEADELLLDGHTWRAI